VGHQDLHVRAATFVDDGVRPSQLDHFAARQTRANPSKPVPTRNWSTWADDDSVAFG
jgi:hypothetical protein